MQDVVDSSPAGILPSHLPYFGAREVHNEKYNIQKSNLVVQTREAETFVFAALGSQEISRQLAFCGFRSTATIETRQRYDKKM
jgi:hypothetical protein